MTDKSRVHLRGRAWRTTRRTACGMREPKYHTATPSKVTCRLCQRTVAMADAEIRQRRARL